jgi:hypothetical protein
VDRLCPTKEKKADSSAPDTLYHGNRFPATPWGYRILEFKVGFFVVRTFFSGSCASQTKIAAGVDPAALS